MSKPMTYLRSCIWLWVPPLVASFTLWPSLGAAYQPEEFWRDIPGVLGLVEHATRIAVIALSVIMVLEWRTPTQQWGMLVYLVGLALYIGCQWLIVIDPTGPWARSVFGFLAPAYTPLIWMVGIGMIGERVMIPNLPWRRWIFYSLGAVFLGAHIAHASLVYLRLN